MPYLKTVFIPAFPPADHENPEGYYLKNSHYDEEGKGWLLLYVRYNTKQTSPSDDASQS